MSADKAIPERWRALYEHCNVGENTSPLAPMEIIRELGTAESLIRELAEVVESTRNAIPKLRISDKQSLVIYLSAALARIPKELLP